MISSEAPITGTKTMATEIDLVIPMVFPQDPEWQQEFARCHGGEARQHVRWRSWGTEELLVRCVMRFMPWVRCIHILLAQESQVQGWMRKLKNENGKLKIVFHHDFIPEELLPCFASPCIEMFLHRIPGLSECFIYANDDMFPLSPLEATDFFRQGEPDGTMGLDGNGNGNHNFSLFTLHSSLLLPCQRIASRAYPAHPNVFVRKCMWQQNMVAKPFGLRFENTYPDTGHGFSPILKSSCKEVWRRHGEEITANLSPIRRTDRSANNWVYLLYQQYSGRYVDHLPPHHYADQTTTAEQMVEMIRDPEAGVVCLNDNECIADWERRAEIVRNEISAKLKIEN